MFDPSSPAPHMYCPHCGLRVALRAPYMTLEVCPRCMARNRVARPMVLESPDGAEESEPESAKPDAFARAGHRARRRTALHARG
jgi:hypothetical protein